MRDAPANLWALRGTRCSCWNLVFGFLVLPPREFLKPPHPTQGHHPVAPTIPPGHHGGGQLGSGRGLGIHGVGVADHGVAHAQEGLDTSAQRICKRAHPSKKTELIGPICFWIAEPSRGFGIVAKYAKDVYPGKGVVAKLRRTIIRSSIPIFSTPA